MISLIKDFLEYRKEINQRKKEREMLLSMKSDISLLQKYVALVDKENTVGVTMTLNDNTKIDIFPIKTKPTDSLKNRYYEGLK